MSQHDSQWKAMKEAAKELNVTYTFIRRLADSGRIQTREDITDRRSKLVDVQEIRQLLQQGK